MTKKGIRAVLAALAVMLTAASASAAGGSPYDRRDTVAETERYQKANPAAKVHPNAWKKINGVCYNGSGVKIEGAITRGIDVSSWQDHIDWSKIAKNQVDFAFIRVSAGLTYMDSKFDENMRGANANNVPAGVYLYSHAKTPEDALLEAQMVISKMQGHKVSYPVVFDLEASGFESMTAKQISDIAVAFCEEVKKAGYYPMVYTNTNWYNNVLDKMRYLSQYPCWLARYGDKILAPDRSLYKYTIWQATDGDTSSGLNSTVGLIPGIAAGDTIDVNFGYVDYTKIITPRTRSLSTYKPTQVAVNGWREENGQTYYYRNGQKVKGRTKIGGKYYRFASNDGHLYKDTIFYSRTTGATCYVNAKGEEVHGDWAVCKGKKYYLGQDGFAYRGSRCINGKFYFFDTKYGYLKTKWKLVTSQKAVYYYDENGVRFNKGFKTLTENGKKNTYYFGKNGEAYRGWQIIEGKRYFFYGTSSSLNSVRVENRTERIGNLLCVFNKDGVCTRRTVIQK